MSVSTSCSASSFWPAIFIFSSMVCFSVRSFFTVSESPGFIFSLFASCHALYAFSIALLDCSTALRSFTSALAIGTLSAAWAYWVWRSSSAALASSSWSLSPGPRTNSTSPALTSCPALTMTRPMVSFALALTLWLPLAATVPVPRTLAVMVPSVTIWVATSGRE